MEKIIDEEDIKRFRSARNSSFLNLIFYGSLGLCVFNFVFRISDALTPTYYGYDGRLFMIFMCLFAIIPLFFIYSFWDFRSVRFIIGLLELTFVVLSVTLMIRYLELIGVSSEPEFIISSLFLTQNLLSVGLFTLVSVSLFIINSLLLCYPYKIDDIFTPGGYWNDKITGKTFTILAFMIMFFVMSLIMFFSSMFGILLIIGIGLCYGIISLVKTIVLLAKDVVVSLDYYKSHYSKKDVLYYFMFCLIIGGTLFWTFFNLAKISYQGLFLVFGAIILFSFVFRLIVDRGSKPKLRSNIKGLREYEYTQKENFNILLHLVYFMFILFGASFLFSINASVFTELSHYVWFFVVIGLSIPVSHFVSRWISFYTQIIFGLLLEGFAALNIYYVSGEIIASMDLNSLNLIAEGVPVFQSFYSGLLLGMPVGICIAGFISLFSDYHYKVKKHGYLYEFGMFLMFSTFFSGFSLSRIYQIDGTSTEIVLSKLYLMQSYSYISFLVISALIAINLIALVFYSIKVHYKKQKEVRNQ